MKGVFQFGDRLMVRPVPVDHIQAGDVVVYWRGDHPESRVEVAHRVVRVLPDGLVAQGDNNTSTDGVLVTADNLVGRVSLLERHGKWQRVPRAGLAMRLARVRHGGHWLLQAVRLSIRITGRRLYGRVRESGLLSRLWRPSIQKGLFMSPGGPVLKYIHRNRTVGTYWISRGLFKCRKPYDLLLQRKGIEGQFR